MTKFLHVADLHLDYQQYGIREREEDAYIAFEAVIDYAISEQVDVFMVAGDFFHSKDIRARAWLRVRKLLERAKMFGVKVVMIEGNHDRALFGTDETWVETLESEELATVLGRGGMPMTALKDGVRIVGIPYLGHKEGEALDRVHEFLDLNIQMPTILLCHIGVSEVMGGIMPGLSLADLEAKVHPSVEYVATGHFHRPWNQNRVHCPGTIFPNKIDEPYGGMFCFEADGEGVRDVTYIPITEICQVRPIVQEEAEDLEQVVALSIEWEGAIVQLTYRGTEGRERLESVFECTPLKFILAYKSGDNEGDVRHYQASSTGELERLLLEELLNDEADVAMQLLEYAADGQSATTMVQLIKERAGIDVD